MKYPHIGQSVTLYNNGYSIAMTLPETYKAFKTLPSFHIMFPLDASL